MAMAGIITALVAQKSSKERVNIYLDGEFAFGLTLLEALKLRKGQHLTDADIARLRALDEIAVAHERALRFLSYRPRSVQEIRHMLSDKGHDMQTVEVIIQRLQEVGLVDDQAFARFWVDNRNQFRPRSTRALRFELTRKGVSTADIAAVLDGLDEDELAYRAALPQARRLVDAERPVFRKRLGEFLVRRGFSYVIARRVVERLWDEVSAGSTNDNSIDLNNWGD